MFGYFKVRLLSAGINHVESPMVGMTECECSPAFFFMSKVNKKAVDNRVSKTTRLAGGAGAFAATQGAEDLLRRAVMGCLLWEDAFYETGSVIAANIKSLIPQVKAEVVAAMAIEARTKQKLRHVPMYMARVMAGLDTHKHVVGGLLPQILLRGDEPAEFLALYWKDGKCPISNQVKIGLAKSFDRLTEYGMAKYSRGTAVKLRDVMFLVHPKPNDIKGLRAYTAKERKNGSPPVSEREHLYQRLAEKELAIPDTWEVALSNGADKKSSWERLISEKKLGALAFMRNLRNMEEAKVDPTIIRKGFIELSPQWLLPLNFMAAAQHAPRWEREIEELMLRNLQQRPKLPGHTVVIVDTSGSTAQKVSSKSHMTCLDAEIAMAMMALEMCETISIYATAGGDAQCQHKTALVPPRRGFGLKSATQYIAKGIGSGGIFTRQCLEYVQSQERSKVDRIIVLSDSQDCDHNNKALPEPFGTYNYIVNVAAHSRGVAYKGVWTAEVSGWSEHFLDYIAVMEGLKLQVDNESAN